jgi:fatty acid desaturase (delta-4 desaturase)
LEGFPVAAVPQAPYPNDSELYNAIRERVRREVFKGQDNKGAHRSGSEGAALAVLGYAVAAYALYSYACNPLTGFLLGLAGAWIGLTIQHCGNHGAMSTKTWVNKALGLTDDLIGGSSLMWRYHHQVSHHIHCNDDALDEDVFSAFPALRFDARLPRKWFHKYQHIYMWATFPLLQLMFQVGDWQGLLQNRSQGATMYGANTTERVSVVVGKLLHYGLMYALPVYLHGYGAAALGALTYVFTEGIVLAATFAVSHNVEEAKPVAAGSPTTDSLQTELAERDWGVQQVLTSANWGGNIGNFFTGGLNLQIEHHLFPAISFMHYPAISRIVADECRKRGIQYAHYDTLPQIISRFIRYMAEVGVAEQMPMRNGTLYTDDNAMARSPALAKL